MRSSDAAPLLAALLCGCAAAPLSGAPPDRLDLSDEACRPFDLREEAARHEATVLVFWATGCPCVARYQARIDELRRILDERVLVLAVSSNADDELADVVRAYGARSSGEVPLRIDPDGGLARALGVPTTPTAVLLDRQGRVRFRGHIDDERLPGDPGRTAYLEEAVFALLEGREVPASSPIAGCAITASLGGGDRCAARRSRDP